MLAGLYYVNIHTTTNPGGEIRGQLALIDTNYYDVGEGSLGAGSSYIAGQATLDPGTLLFTWNVSWGVPLLHLVTGTDFHGPAVGNENAPAIIAPAGNSGSATLTAARAAELINGFWYYQVNDVNGAFRGYIRAQYPKLKNISTRLDVGTGGDVGIAGFIVGGTTPKTVAIVGTGPSLSSSGIPNPLADPKLTLVRSSDQAIVATNDDWQSDFPGSFYHHCGYSPSNAKESALMVTLDPGVYTAILEGADGGSGVGLVAVYECTVPESPLVNISTRGRVETGPSVMIAGLIVTGNAPKTVVIRARGPSLVPYGIANALANPAMYLVRQSDQSIIASNDDWQGAGNAADVIASGFAPSDPLESAILVTLDPGAYTAIVSGADGGTGVGIVEVFAVP